MKTNKFSRRAGNGLAIILLPLLLASAPTSSDESGRSFGRKADLPRLLAQSTTILAHRPAGTSPLGDYYRDDARGFAIRVPLDMWVDTRNPKFAVKFISRTNDAFIMINLIPVPAAVDMNQAFANFITKKNQEVEERIPTYRLQSSGSKKFPKFTAYYTMSVFKIGKITVNLTTYYIPGKNKIFMISTVCPQAVVSNWGLVFEAAVASFSLIE